MAILIFCGAVLLSYLIFLGSLNAWSQFGRPFVVEQGRIYFGTQFCNSSTESLEYYGGNDSYGLYQCAEKEDYTVQHNPAKPIIYLYPKQTTEILVKLGNPEKISVSYPEYNNGWQVIAEPNGDLTEINSGKKLYSLYWEGKDSTLKTTDEGFVIPGNQTAEFLDEKLKILGLNDHEREEFIIYWLPKMQDNNFNYIRFATEAEIEENMPLEVTPEPDTTIRVMMVTEPLENYKEVKEQALTPKTRSGYTVVEWGGSVDGNAK